MKSKKKGLMGVGVLIVLIAVIIVAAIAASVIIYTAGGLQSRSYSSGKEAEENVATGVEVVTLMGSDGSQGRDLEHFEMYVRLASGSDTINLNHTLILVDSETETQVLNLGEFTGNLPSGTQSFNINYVKQGPDYEPGYLSRGDTAKILFNYYQIADPTATTGGVGENQNLRIKIMPIEGTAAIVEFKTPDTITTERFTLWP